MYNIYCFAIITRNAILLFSLLLKWIHVWSCQVLYDQISSKEVVVWNFYSYLKAWYCWIPCFISSCFSFDYSFEFYCFCSDLLLQNCFVHAYYNWLFLLKASVESKGFDMYCQYFHFVWFIYLFWLYNQVLAVVALLVKHFSVLLYSWWVLSKLCRMISPSFPVLVLYCVIQMYLLWLAFFRPGLSSVLMLFYVLLHWV